MAARSCGCNSHIQNSAQALADRVTWAVDRAPRLESMRSAAREEYEKKYTAARNYQILMAIYREAAEQRGSGAHRPAQPRAVLNPQ